jgi:hypothetical protein
MQSCIQKKNVSVESFGGDRLICLLSASEINDGVVAMKKVAWKQSASAIAGMHMDRWSGVFIRVNTTVGPP